VPALKQVIEKLDPRLVILSHTYQVRDFASKAGCGARKNNL